jgi:hypothetical protein
MLVVIQLSKQALEHPPSLEALARFAIEHELAVVCNQGVELAVIGMLRRTLPRHRVVALLGDQQLLHQEVGLIKELLNEGRLPVLMAFDDSDGEQLQSCLEELAGWLDADLSLTLPSEVYSVG